MAKNSIINVNLFGQEIGRIGMDQDVGRSSFQFNPTYLESNKLTNIFPKTGILKRTTHVQMFSQFDNTTFKGIPPQFADSLPDMFGSIIFNAWLEGKQESNITVLEHLAYIGNRGMGALEYSPAKKLPNNTTIDLNEITKILQDVLDLKKSSRENKLSNSGLINIFKIGTSAGGARPKIIISENKTNGTIIPGDLEYSNDYNHYLIKLALDEKSNYPREIIEFCYYQLIKKADINIMPSHLIENKHFATERFDRQNGEKIHVLTATGLTGWDFKSPEYSSYENLFKLCSFLKVPHSHMEELFRRMVFNVIFKNTDDHLKNHSFLYNKAKNTWSLAPAYDITYSLNPLIDFKKTKRALSINGKRSDITKSDLLKIADEYTIKNPSGVIKTIASLSSELTLLMKECGIPNVIVNAIDRKVINGIKSLDI